MKKLLLTLFSILLGSIAVWAQEVSVVTESVEKVDRTCLRADYLYTKSIVSDALEAKLMESGIGKGDRVKGGFRVYKGVSIPEIVEDKIDLYTKVSGKKGSSTLFLLASRGYDNFITPESEPEVMEKMKAFIKSMVGNVNIEKLKIDIAAQARIVNKAEKASKSEIKKGNDLVSDMKSLENKLERNKKDQEANKKDQDEAQKVLGEEEAKLNELKSKLEMLVK